MTDGGRPQEKEETYSEGTLEPQVDRNGSVFEDVMSVDWDEHRGAIDTIVSSARTPNTQTIFGVYTPMPNSMRYRVPYELVLKQKNLKDDNKRDIDKKRQKITTNFQRYHGEFLHAMVVAVTTMPNRCLSFQVIFTGYEVDDDDEENIHGGAMWARMPITALVGDTPVDEWAKELPPYIAQPWDCMSHDHSVYVINRATPAPWIAKVDGEFFPAKYYFTVDYTNSEIADDPAQHKQSHVLELMNAGEYTGNIVALPNNRVRVTHPAWFETGKGSPDFLPSQRVFHSKQEFEYVWDTGRVFNNLYAKEEDQNDGNA